MPNGRGIDRRRRVDGAVSAPASGRMRSPVPLRPWPRNSPDQRGFVCGHGECSRGLRTARHEGERCPGASHERPLCLGSSGPRRGRPPHPIAALSSVSPCRNEACAAPGSRHRASGPIRPRHGRILCMAKRRSLTRATPRTTQPCLARAGPFNAGDDRTHASSRLAAGSDRGRLAMPAVFRRAVNGLPAMLTATAPASCRSSAETRA